MKFELKENEKERSREKEKENSSTSTTTKDFMNSGKDPLPPVRIPFSAALLRDAARRIGMPSDEVRGRVRALRRSGLQQGDKDSAGAPVVAETAAGVSVIQSEGGVVMDSMTREELIDKSRFRLQVACETVRGEGGEARAAHACHG